MNFNEKGKELAYFSIWSIYTAVSVFYFFLIAVSVWSIYTAVSVFCFFLFCFIFFSTLLFLCLCFDIL
ncbi:hypothetical protein RchiOBHm_Chr3g0495001 [Rosa chinensis]|uniref:Uncharacterized protein n=1 Tax=Rosa chinensis TaxID=74649 RepID=A0A2P6RH53_ROSCH|nr:hypothetical protein RchiOBHm_Chr3g0495001 [Rosa chinensis]